MKRTHLGTLILATLSLHPVAALAEPPRVAVAPVVASDTLSEQEREILALAQEFSARCTQQLEGWVTKKEISVDRLFAALYYPKPQTNPLKFTTDWDHLSDRDIQAIEEAVLTRSPSIVFAFMVDKHGYVPTHNLRYSQPLTGNVASDLLTNRTKRMLSDRTGLFAAKSEAPFLIQKYQQDTGDSFNDLSVPIYVKGVHWGAVRIGYRPVDGR